jgi:hypothetical protein
MGIIMADVLVGLVCDRYGQQQGEQQGQQQRQTPVPANEKKEQTGAGLEAEKGGRARGLKEVVCTPGNKAPPYRTSRLYLMNQHQPNFYHVNKSC